ncbi:hypothetical protein MJN51_32115, partial [Salmonella enterica subsp. enterica serovar Kentucky]|nr:hypothetical protein [Salmonella enterica subsp. enterica serovar Kentucky]
GWKRFLIPELSLKYKYKDFAPFRVEKPTQKSELKYSNMRALKLVLIDIYTMLNKYARKKMRRLL